MLNAIGNILLILAALTAFAQCILPAYGYYRNNIGLMKIAPALTLLAGFWVSSAFCLLIIAFLQNDFSLQYVAQNSHFNLPIWYKLTAVWGAHEGSFLLWIFLLNIWSIAVCVSSRKWLLAFRTLTLAVLGCISCCFLLFLQTSNPFLINMGISPQDLNPLLQDPGFFIHPPMLYAGYVGFSAVFAITLAYLCLPKISAQNWAQTIRPYALAAWSLLTIGIVLGSWWAYHVLGWGGFWFWDPVENASLLPWLSGIALIHVLVIIDKKQTFVDWGILLAILTFSLSILGTFLVRSGVLISVHSFANDPSRGFILLLLLAGISGGALLLYLWRKLQVTRASAEHFIYAYSARECILLLQSILLFIVLATVLLGTLYPLMMEAGGWGSLSVGAPYFNQVLLPLVILGLLGMIWAPFTQWGNTHLSLKKFWQQGLAACLSSLLLLLFFAGNISLLILLSLTLFIWLILSTKSFFLRQSAMSLAHLGFAILVLSAVLAASFSQEREVRILIGEHVTLGPYVLHFKDIEGVQGENYKGIRANFALLRQNTFITELRPEKRIYKVRNMVMSKVAIYPGIFHDVYLTLGEPYSENDWSLRLYYKPFIRWIWLAGLLMALAGLIALCGGKKS